jgi:hypothetical protein
MPPLRGRPVPETPLPGIWTSRKSRGGSVSRWAKMDSGLDSNPKICAAGRVGREVFLFLLRRNAALEADGEIPVSNVLPEYLARQLDMPVTEARDAVVTLVTVGLIVTDVDFVRFLGWSDEWKGPKSNAERQATFRAKREAKQAKSDKGVTPSNAKSRDVTKSNRLRGEEKRREKSVRGLSPMPAGWEPNETSAKRASELGLSLTAEVADFREWTTAKGKAYADWQAAFRVHLASQAKRQTSRNVIPISGSPPLKEPLLYDGYAASKQREADEKARQS